MAGALVLVAGVTTGAVVANSGPSAAQVRAKAARLAAAQEAAHQAAMRAVQAQLIAALKISPVAGSAGVALNAPVTVSTTLGTLQAVRVTSTAGSLTGALNAAGTEWVAHSALAPTSTYTVAVTAIGSGGATAQKRASFSTLTPAAQVTATVWPTTGLQVGVGQPIVVTFDHDIGTAAAQAAVVSHFTVAMSKPVPGGWYWFSPHEVHFRPETYWPAGEQVQVTGNLNGWNAGAGLWGAGVVTDAFSVGDARIAYANLLTDEMTVTLNGATLAAYPISGGRTQYPTMDGIHVVLDKETVVHMVSSTVGIPVNSPNGYDEYVYDDVHISDSGEYVHAAPWSVGSQGVTNVSHGCINVSPSNALAFYNFSEVGDLVVVTGSPRPPAVGDHGVMDWDTPWNQWMPGRVVRLAATAPATTTTVATTSLATTPATTTPPATPATTTSPPTTAATTTTPTTRPSPTTVTTKPKTTTTT
jgi:lipoprotein-anchoring transpeptidase ErfK/SrfK